jgi:hypothetical protein
MMNSDLLASAIKMHPIPPGKRTPEQHKLLFACMKAMGMKQQWNKIATSAKANQILSDYIESRKAEGAA